MDVAAQEDFNSEILCIFSIFKINNKLFIFKLTFYFFIKENVSNTLQLREQ